MLQKYHTYKNLSIKYGNFISKFMENVKKPMFIINNKTK